MRRVEPKVDGVGRGMSADPDHILELEAEWARFQRANKKPPKKPFKKVMRDKELQKEGFI